MLSRRLSSLLSVRPGEGRLALLLFMLSFCLGSAMVLIYVAGLALFLVNFGAAQLAYVYLTAAGTLMAAGLGFTWLATRVNLGGLLIVLWVVVTLITVVIGLALRAPEPPSWLIFGLMVWAFAVYTLVPPSFWTLAGRLYNLDQGKRLFGLVGSGELVARLLIYPATALLVQLAGTEGLILIAVGFTAGAALLLLLIGLGQRRELGQADLAEATPARRAGGLLRRPYIIQILLTVLLAEIIFLLLEYLFSAQAEQRFGDADTLSAFLGLFFGMIYLLGVLVSSFVSGPLIRRYGMRFALVVGPALGAVGMVASVASAALFPVALFGLVVGTKFIDELGRRAVQRNAFQLLYQPLSPAERTRAQAIAQSIVEPGSMGASGLLMLLFAQVSVGDVPLMLAVLAGGAIWMGLLLLLYRGYVGGIRQALDRQRLDGRGLSLEDPRSLRVIERAVADPRPGRAIFALDVLARANPAAAVACLPGLVTAGDPLIRSEALRRVSDLRLVAALPAVRQALDHDADLAVRAAAISTYCALEPGDALDVIGPFLVAANGQLRLAAMTGLLRYGGISGVLSVGQRLLQMVESPNPHERALAARCLGAAQVRDFYQPLQLLLGDQNLEVQRAALWATGQVQNPRLWPAVIASLAGAPTRAAAAAALAGGGPTALLAICAGLADDGPDRAVRLSLIQICGRSPAPEAGATLAAMLAVPDDEVRHAVILALRRHGYRAEGARAEIVRAQLRAEVGYAALIADAGAALAETPGCALLRDALAQQVGRLRERCLTLIGLLGDPTTAQQIQIGMRSRQPQQRAYARELLEHQIPADQRGPLLRLLAAEEPPARAQALPRPAEVVRSLIDGSAAFVTPWVRSCACYTAEAVGLVPQPVEEPMQTTIERVLILKSVELFRATDDALLADLAGRLKEVDLPARATLFEKGDAGDSMYIIVSGKLRVHDDGQTLNTLGEADVVGEMSLLDEEPRVASVTAEEDTLLLRLDQAAFYELMDDHIEIARGVIRVLSQRLRDRVADLRVARATVAGS